MNSAGDVDADSDDNRRPRRVSFRANFIDAYRQIVHVEKHFNQACSAEVVERQEPTAEGANKAVTRFGGQSCFHIGGQRAALLERGFVTNGRLLCRDRLDLLVNRRLQRGMEVGDGREQVAIVRRIGRRAIEVGDGGARGPNEVSGESADRHAFKRRWLIPPSGDRRPRHQFCSGLDSFDDKRSHVRRYIHQITSSCSETRTLAAPKNALARDTKKMRSLILYSVAMTEISVRIATDLAEDARLADQLARCWLDVSNAGGAVGFPFLPVSIEQVNEATQLLVGDVAAGLVLVFVAEVDGDVVGWVSLRFNSSKLTQHWATVERLQSRPEHRGLGIGRQLMESLAAHAASIGLEQLRLGLRGGESLEAFYETLSWREVARYPDALRLPNGDRDEVWMLLDLRRN